MTMTMTTSDVAVAPRTGITADLAEKTLIAGDLGKLSAGERVSFYRAVCESLGLNPLTQPFQYLSLNGRLTLYARKDATDQLRAIHRINLTIVGRERMEDVYVVTARATTVDGRTDESIGAVAIGGLKGEALSNAIMKSETKAKRRVTLSICGLGWTDETEVETIPQARMVTVDLETGELPAQAAEPRRSPELVCCAAHEGGQQCATSIDPQGEYHAGEGSSLKGEAILALSMGEFNRPFCLPHLRKARELRASKATAGGK